MPIEMPDLALQLFVPIHVVRRSLGFGQFRGCGRCDPEQGRRQRGSDDLGQGLGGLVAVVLELAEQAAVLGGDLLGQVALGDARDRLIDQCLVGGGVMLVGDQSRRRFGRRLGSCADFRPPRKRAALRCFGAPSWRSGPSGTRAATWARS